MKKWAKDESLKLVNCKLLTGGQELEIILGPLFCFLHSIPKSV